MQLEKKECLRRQERRITYSPGNPSPSYLECRDCKQGRAIMNPAQEDKRMEDKNINKPEDPTLKRCSKCGEVKPLDDFGSNKQAPDGRNWGCKTCTAKVQRERYGKSHSESNTAKRPIAKKQKPEPKHPDLDSLIEKLKIEKIALMAEVDRINTTLSMIQERM